MRKAFIPASFNPPTYGHMNVIGQALKMFDEVIIGIGSNPDKSSRQAFTPEQCKEMLETVAQTEFPASRITIIIYEGLTIVEAKKHGCCAMVRGLRDFNDYHFELNLAHVNRSLDPDILTVFVPSAQELTHISSSAVMQIARAGGPFQQYVPKCIVRKIEEFLARI